jgi:Zn-dependent protease
MQGSLHLGRIRGVRISLHVSTIAVAGFIALVLAGAELPNAAPGYRPAAYFVVGVCVAIIFLGTVLLHEIAHALVARARGVGVRGITLWALGGFTEMDEGVDRSPSIEALVAIAGPAVNAVVGLLLVACYVAARGHMAALIAEPVEWLAAINILMAAFNVLPAAPLDGGRLLHAAVWRITRSPRVADRAATLAGQVLGVLVVAGAAWSLGTGNVLDAIWLGLLGWFLYAGARAGGSSAALRRAIAGLTAADAMVPQYGPAPAWLSLEVLIGDGAIGPDRPAIALADWQGRPVGVLTWSAVAAVPFAERRITRAGSCLSPGARVQVVEASTPLEHLLSQGQPFAVVVAGGQVVGAVSPESVQRVTERRREPALL